MRRLQVTFGLLLVVASILVSLTVIPHVESAKPLLGTYRTYLPLTQLYRPLDNAVLHDYVAVAVGPAIVNNQSTDLFRIRADGSEIALLAASEYYDLRPTLS